MITTLTNIPRLIKSYFKNTYDFPNSCRFGFLLSLIESIFIGIFYYLSIYLVDTLHIDIPTTGIIISCYGIGAIFGGIVGGKLSDLTSPGVICTISLFIQAVSYFVFTIVASPILLMMNVFILGIASYSFITANHLFVLGECKDDENQRLKAISILSMISNLGLGLSAIVLGSLLSIGFHLVFLITSAFVFALGIASTYYEIILNKSTNQSFTAHQSQHHGDTTDTTKPYEKSILMMALLCVFFIGMVVTQSSVTYVLYIKEMFPAYGIQAVTILFTINSFIVVLASTILCDYIKDYNKLIMLGIGAFLIGIGMTILIVSHLFFIAVLACIVNTVGEIIFFAVSQLLCYQSGGKGRKGTSLGLYRAVYASSRALGPTAGSLIYYKTSGDMLWIICGALGTIALISCTLLNSWKTNRDINLIENISTI
jgi:predicted MFS family arabinose efflux permease